MALRLQELQQREAITNPDGTPSQYFLRYLKSRGGALTDLEAELLLKAEKTTQIIAGTGLTGGGTLASDVTIDADTQEILDQLSTTQGAILYRGATDWSALAPGTSGQVLTTGGAGANPSWTTSSGGGSGLYVSKPLPVGTSASSTGQASKGLQFTAELAVSLYGVRTMMTGKAGATYEATVWTLSGGNLGTKLATTPSWTGVAAVDEWHEALFTGSPISLSAGVSYVVLVTATSETNTYAFPMYSTTNATYMDAPFSNLVYARIATNAPASGNAVSTGSGNYSVALITNMGL